MSEGCTGNVYGDSAQTKFDISEFQHLEELDIFEERGFGRPFKGREPFLALVDWHNSFKDGSQSLQKLR